MVHLRTRKRCLHYNYQAKNTIKLFQDGLRNNYTSFGAFTELVLGVKNGMR